MFTGLVQKVGRVTRVSRGRGLVLEFQFDPWPEPLVKGESVAVNGVCLTVCACDATRFTADVLGETERRTGLAGLLPGARVNLERAMKAGDRFGGHVVQGHVDGRGTVAAKIAKGRDFALRISCPRAIAAATVLKGSIAVNGVSLTVSGLGAGSMRSAARKRWTRTRRVPPPAASPWRNWRRTDSYEPRRRQNRDGPRPRGARRRGLVVPA